MFSKFLLCLLFNIHFYQWVGDFIAGRLELHLYVLLPLMNSTTTTTTTNAVLRTWCATPLRDGRGPALSFPHQQSLLPEEAATVSTRTFIIPSPAPVNELNDDYDDYKRSVADLEFNTTSRWKRTYPFLPPPALITSRRSCHCFDPDIHHTVARFFSREWSKSLMRRSAMPIICTSLAVGSNVVDAFPGPS